MGRMRAIEAEIASQDELRVTERPRPNSTEGCPSFENDQERGGMSGGGGVRAREG